jgi:hypothetical protein
LSFDDFVDRVAAETVVLGRPNFRAAQPLPYIGAAAVHQQPGGVHRRGEQPKMCREHGIETFGPGDPARCGRHRRTR